MWHVTEIRDSEVRHLREHYSKEQAIQTAVDWAEECGLIYEKGTPKSEFVNQWTREELWHKLDREGQYEDGEVVVKIEEVKG